ncbi:hypothetical protein R3W88_022911 [Solanum pinnatisectum]|uniref:Uncharacterized protein n=1 Tax=Solanum pinnatisectum TaxID=50273 RepID=A0AAV9LW91_9SOLN|nr:hypothetical protein R3W88_022911 [Solanum pinnatisectum]
MSCASTIVEYTLQHTEFLNEGKDLPTTIDPEEMRIRYASLLWNYDTQKIQVDAVSDSETSLKPVRNHTDCDISERITIH